MSYQLHQIHLWPVLHLTLRNFSTRKERRLSVFDKSVRGLTTSGYVKWRQLCANNLLYFMLSMMLGGPRSITNVNDFLSFHNQIDNFARHKNNILQLCPFQLLGHWCQRLCRRHCCILCRIFRNLVVPLILPFTCTGKLTVVSSRSDGSNTGHVVYVKVPL